MQNDLKEIRQQLDRLEKNQELILSLLHSRPAIEADDWINEVVAASSLGVSIRTLRENVKKGIYQPVINFRTTQGKKYQYSRMDIITYKKETSTESH